MRYVNVTGRETGVNDKGVEARSADGRVGWCALKRGGRRLCPAFFVIFMQIRKIGAFGVVFWWGRKKRYSCLRGFYLWEGTIARLARLAAFPGATHLLATQIYSLLSDISLLCI